MDFSGLPCMRGRSDTMRCLFLPGKYARNTRMIRARLAPSPTGLLHLGNAWAFLAAWLAARSAGGAVVLRMEDIDPARSRAAYSQSICDDLSWLGLNWDEGPDNGPYAPYCQSLRLSAYAAALAALENRGLVYPCFCTRKELRTLAGAPHMEDAGAPYPGTCRALDAAKRAELLAMGRKAAMRLTCPPEHIWRFTDRVSGPQQFTLAECGGDFALCRSDGVFAYQLAVVADDIAMRISQVVRGADILSSTARQLYLYSLFGAFPPEYAHVPLLLDHEGERLAKRHQSLSLHALREAGVRAGTIVGALLHLSGLRESYAPFSAQEALAGFGFERIRHTALRLPQDPLQWLLSLQT